MTDFLAGGLKLLMTNCLEDCSADATACPQSVIRSVDYGIRVQIRNTDFPDLNRAYGSVF